MDTNNSSGTNFGVDPTGLKQEQTPDFLVLSHPQTSLQGLPLVQFAGFVEVTESFGQIASPKATSLVDLQRLVELSVLPFVQNKFQELYERTDWAEILKVSFGDDVDLAEGRELLSQLAAGKGILPVEVVETEDLKAQGAFGDDRVFLGDELVRSGNVQAIAQVVVEEIGHSLDRKINISDAAGDEGEIFADLVFDKPLSAMNLATLKAEDDRAVREISGQGLAVELSAFPIQGSIRIFYDQANGVATLGNPLNALQPYAGGLVQDFERGIIFQSAAGTFVARGAIGELYRFRFALTGLPTGDEVVTSYGVRQNFGNKIVFSSPQFGTQVLLDNVASFYQGLADWQRDQLGAPYSSELSLVAGGFRQFFKGGTIEWKANGTGEVKYTSYPIGFNGTSIDNAFLFKFNAADGFTTLGNPSGNVQAVAGGSIQDFERGMIIQTNAGIFALDTYVSSWYRQDPNALGLPTSDRVSISGGFKQEFEKGIVFGNSNNQ